MNASILMPIPKPDRVNIPSIINDVFYAYKMPALKVYIFVKGGEIYTEIIKLQEVACALRISPICNNRLI